MIQPREARWSTIVLFLVVQTILITLLVVFGMELLVSVARATGWIIQSDLIAGGLLLILVVGGILLWRGGLRLSDVGLIRAQLPLAILVTAGFWLFTQIILLLSSLLHSGTVAWHPQWSDPGVVATLSFLAAMLFGTPLYEEVAFRGFLFPQLYLKFGGGHGRRVWTAAITSAVPFSVMHIPTRLVVSQVGGADLVPHLVILTLAGLFGVVMYLRTENLLVVTGIHALVNAPTQLVAAPIGPFAVTVVLSAVLWIAWPRLFPSVLRQRRVVSIEGGATV